MGSVYLARDTDLRRDVALKFIRPELLTAAATVARFEREARITATLAHPGIPPVHALGRLPDGQPFLVMKLIHGRTLEELLAARPDPSHELDRFIEVFEQICQAVAYAHSRGVIHRDLKPANVMVGEFGEVQVMDWGLAKVLGEGGDERGPDGAEPCGPELTGAGVLGTPAYMPPEQARGETGTLGKSADVYSLGAILCVVLTGRPPLTGGVADVLRRSAAGELSDAHESVRRSGADPGLISLALACLSPTPAGRPADAAEVGAAVRAARESASDWAKNSEFAQVVVRERQAARTNQGRRFVGLSFGLLVCAYVGYLLAATDMLGTWVCFSVLLLFIPGWLVLHMVMPGRSPETRKFYHAHNPFEDEGAPHPRGPVALRRRAADGPQIGWFRRNQRMLVVGALLGACAAIPVLHFVGIKFWPGTENEWNECSVRNRARGTIGVAYSNDVPRKKAVQFAEFLARSAEFGGPGSWVMAVERPPGGWLVSFFLTPGVDVHPELRQYFQQLRQELSEHVFDNDPVAIQLCRGWHGEPIRPHVVEVIE
jgi:hypothetical protein